MTDELTFWKSVSYGASLLDLLLVIRELDSG
jgi:hypothetical protein